VLRPNFVDNILIDPYSYIYFAGQKDQISSLCSISFIAETGLASLQQRDPSLVQWMRNDREDR